MQNSKLSLVKLKNTSKKHQSYEALKRDVLKILSEIPNIKALHNDLEVLAYVTNLIENSDYQPVDKSLNYDKEQLAVDIMTEQFPQLIDDIVSIKNNITYLWQNKKIKKISRCKFYSHSFVDFVKKKNFNDKSPIL